MIKQLILLFSTFFFVAATHAQPRHALVIGNAQYINESELVNTLNDARDVANVLSDQLGFSVTKVENANRKELGRAVNDFVRGVQDSKGVALIYYSGHGMQDSRGKNYLLPVDAEITDAMDIALEGLALTDLLTGLEEREDAVNLVILDACRNNPFKTATKSIGSKGLSGLKAPPSGTLILYATKPNRVASDNPAGRNGLFTKHLLNVMNVPGIEVEQAFKQASEGVYAESNKQQDPWMEGRIRGRFAFVPETILRPAPAPSPIVTQPQTVSQQQLREWAEKCESNYYSDNFDEAAKWCLKAAEQGHANAQTSLGVMYTKGRGVPQDDDKAVDWHRQAVEQGYARAQYNLGVMYTKGRGVPEDDKQAVYWYRQAVEQGYAYAQFNLGWMYEKGRGVPQDDEQAVYWYRQAAEQGHVYAQNNLGWMYEKGRGVPQDDDKAVDWYRQAAEQGHARAQKNLKILCQEGVADACG